MNKDIVVFNYIIGIAFILIFPYWIFGPYSMVGWYDEYNAVIPWYLNLIKYEELSFLHHYSGGASSKQTYLEGNENLSLIKFGFKYFDLWIVNAFLRILGYTLGIFSFYYFIYSYFKLSRIHALILAAAGFLINFIPYGWMLASLGYGFFGIIVFYYYYFYVNTFNKFSLIIPLISFTIVSVTTPPVFLFAHLVYFIIALSILKRDNFLPNSSYRLFLVFLILFCETANWIMGIYYSSVQTQTFTARLIDSTIPYFNLSFIQIVLKIFHSHILVFTAFIKRDPQYFLLLLYFFSFLLTFLKEKFSNLFYLIIVLFALPLFFEIFSKVFRIPLFSSFQFATLWEVHSLILILVIAMHLNKIKNYFLKNLICSLIALASIISFILMTIVTFKDLNLYGGAGTFFHYQSLARLKQNHFVERVISNGHLNPNIPNLYDISTFDGVPHVYPKLRVDFDAFALKKESSSNSTANHAWRVYPTFPDGYNINLFSMAGVSHLISKSLIEDKRFLLIEYEKGKTTHDYFFLKYFPEISLIPDIFIYKFNQDPWPIIFKPSKIIASNSSNYDFEYFNQIKNLSIGEVLLLNSEINNLKGVLTKYEPLTYIKTNSGYRISNVNNSSFVVINTVFTPYWNGYCDGNKVKLFPANGIMMIATLPNQCSTLDLRYETLN
jgi:hypothetical protein